MNHDNPQVVCGKTLSALIYLPVVLFLAGCSGSVPMDTKPVQTAQTNTAPQHIREPSVAGLFYPKEQVDLSSLLDALLRSAPVKTHGELKAIICPHAGYRYSGPTAAYSYKNVVGRSFDTVVVLAPSHYAMFTGASVSDADAWRTPLGMVPVSPKTRQWAITSPFVLESRCLVQRPQWWREASNKAPAPGEDTPHTWEHSAEVQIPFLQKVLKKFELIPIILGQTDAAQVAHAMSDNLDDKTLVVASSDLSHYKPYEAAKDLDQRCVKAICNLDIQAMEGQEACGKEPILTVMHLARQKGWKPELLDYRNSGDTAGDKSGVVGYAAIAFFAAEPQQFTREERKQLLGLARETVKEITIKGVLQKRDEGSFPKKYLEPRGCFVTLTKGGDLRGCIGHIMPQEALYLAVMDNARSAAQRDPRFPAVRTDELDKIEVEVSVLTEPKPLEFSTPEDLLNKLRPYKDGVVLKIGRNSATYLPQVWSQLPDKVEFLNNLSEKAGCPATAWRNPGATVLIYQVEAFKESEMVEPVTAPRAL